MANNQYVNKVQYGSTTLIDLTSDTVTADKLMQGYTAHDRSGALITGTATGGIDLATFTVTGSAATSVATCDKTFSECYSNLYKAHAIVNNVVDMLGEIYEQNQSYLTYVFYLNGVPSASLKYHSDGTIELLDEVPSLDSLRVTENGTYTPRSNHVYNEVVVNVPSGQPTLQTKTATYTPTTSQQTAAITADAGYDGLDEVDITVNAVPVAEFGLISQETGFFTESGERKWRLRSFATADPSEGGTEGWLDDGYYYGSYWVRPAVEATSITPTESSQTIGGSHYMMEGAVTVNAIPSNYVGSGITQRSSSDLTASGATVTAPSGYYGSSASKTIASGTEGTPTATKGTVSNHSISVTPSVTNSAGYISGGTHTGTAVTVTASELVSGTYTVDSSGTKDVTNYASASVPAGTAGTPSASKGTVSNHSVSVTPSVTNQTGWITGSTKTGSAVTVTASELASGNKAITSNGTNIDVVGYSTVSVDVQGGGSTPLHVGEADATSTTASISFTGLLGEPSSFYLSFVGGSSIGLPSGTPYTTIDVVYDGTNDFGNIATNINNAQASYSTNFSHSYSNGTLTVTGTESNFVGHYLMLYSYGGGAVDTKDVQVGSGVTSITFTGLEGEPAYWSCAFKSNFGTSSGYQRTIATSYGYNTFSNTVNGYNMSTVVGCSATSWTASYNNGSLTITSQGTNQGGYFHQPGYYQLTYAYDDGSSGNYQSKTVTPTTSQQVVEADSGYDALKKVTVNAIPSEYIVPTGNINITSNTATGQTLNVAQYATATVAVPSSGSSKNAQTAQSTTRSSSTTYTECISLTCTKAGTYDVYWSTFRSSTTGTWGSQLYINDTAYGTAQTGSWSYHIQNIHLSNVQISANAEVTVRVRTRATNYFGYVGTLTIIEA